MTPGSPNRRQFGELFRRALVAPTRIAQQALVHELGLDAASVSRYASGEDVPAPDTLEAIIDYFRIQGRWSDRDCAEARRLHLLARREPDPKPRDGPVLPRAPALLIGRERDVARLLEALRQPLVRPVMLVGYGGVGKTALARQVAAAFAGIEGDAARPVEIVSLEQVGAREGFWAALARQLGVREGRRDGPTGAATTPPEPLQRRVVKRLRRVGLLVLDGCERLCHDAAPFADLLGECPRLRLLLTTRVFFYLEDVCRHQVEPLALPARKGNLDLAALGDVPAVRLFVELLRGAWPGFELTHRNADALARLCRLVEGLPLAIRLAAANCNPGNLREVADRLERRLADLPVIPAGLPGRHRSLVAALDVSYELLHDRDRRLFRRLGVCHGCSREALRQLSEIEGPAALPADPYALVHSSLLEVKQVDVGERFRMLEVVREYALSKLEPEPEYPLVAAWRRRYYSELAERACARMTEPAAFAAARELDLEHDNVLAVLRSAIAEGASGEAARLAHALRPYWADRGRLSEGRLLLTSVLALSPSDRERAWLHVDSGELALLQGDAIALDAHAAEAGSLFLGRPDSPELMAAIVRLIGEGRLYEGEYRSAVDHFQRALECCRAALDRHDSPAARRELAMVMRRLGLAYRYAAKDAVGGSQAQLRATAASWCERALALADELSDDRQRALALADLAAVLRLSGERADLDRALATAEEALTIARRSGSPPCLAHAAHAVGTVALYRAILLHTRGRRIAATPHFARAEVAITERLAVVWELENLYDTATCLFDLAGIASFLGRGEHAGLLLGACEALMEAEELTFDGDDRETYLRVTEPLRQRHGAARQAGRDKPLREVVAIAVERQRTDKDAATRPIGGSARPKPRRSSRSRSRRR